MSGARVLSVSRGTSLRSRVSLSKEKSTTLEYSVAGKKKGARGKELCPSTSLMWNCVDTSKFTVIMDVV